MHVHGGVNKKKNQLVQRQFDGQFSFLHFVTSNFCLPEKVLPKIVINTLKTCIIAYKMDCFATGTCTSPLEF